MELTVPRLRALSFVLTPFEKAMNFDILSLWKWQIFSCDIKHEGGAVLGGRGPGVLCTYYWCIYIMHVCPAVGPSGLPETGQRFATLKPNTFGARKPCWKSIDAKARSAGKNSRRTVLHCWCMSPFSSHVGSRETQKYSAEIDASALSKTLPSCGGEAAGLRVLFYSVYVSL